MPLSIAELQRSGTAREYDLDNIIPAHLLRRARALGIAGGMLQALGLVVTSAFRSTLVNAVIYFVDEHPGQTADPSRLTPRNTKHSECLALDLGSYSSHMSADAIRDVVLASSLAGIVSYTRNEGDHLHVEFSPEGLAALDDGANV